MYTVKLSALGCVRHYPCANKEDMLTLRGALVKAYGDLCVNVLTITPMTLTPAAPPLTPSQIHTQILRSRLKSLLDARNSALV